MKSLFLLFLTIVFCLNTYGQIDFQDHSIIENSTSVLELQSTYPIDIDGDGDLDILSASQQDDKIAWYENMDGQGLFSSQKLISDNMDGAFTVIAADLDNDGDMDVLASNTNGDHKLVWFENVDGLGTFGTQQIIDFSNTGFLTIDAADFDNDGDIDVLSANGVAIVWYENIDGEGNFGESQVIFTTNPNQTTRALARAFDINGDGFEDVLATYTLGPNFHTKKVVWFTNQEGTGEFSSEHVIIEESASEVLAFDVDGDTDLDVVLALDSEQDIVWYENTDGQGNFGPQQIIATEVGYHMALSAGNLDGDDDLDLLVTSRDSSKITWYENMDGLGAFGDEQIITNLTAGTTNIFATDIDMDGDLDLLSASHLSNTLAWYENTNALGDFGYQQIIVSSAVHASAVFAGDLDGDGDMDVISTSETDNKIAWYENLDGQGNYGTQNNISISAIGVKNIFVIDLDMDGDKDIVSASYINVISDKVFWHENLDGQGHFGEEQIFSEEQVEDIYATDMDGDGDIDIVFAGIHIYWYENIDDQGDFTTQHVVSDFSGTAIQVADMDSDGDLDVIAASSDNKISWYENLDGQGDFGAGEQNEITVLQYTPVDISVADIDGDLDMDVITATESNLFWFENIGGLGDFGSEQAIFENLSLTISAVHTADMDGDGDLDVLSTNGILNKIAWYENIEGTFNGQQLLISENLDRPTSLYVADLDGDGDMDALSSSRGDGKIAWYENKGILGNKIIGNLRFDINENDCSEDDRPMPNSLITTDNGINQFLTFTQADGSFMIKTNEGNFETTVINLPAYNSVSPTAHISNFVGEGNIDMINFCATATELTNDVNITILPPRDAVIGLFAKYQIVYQNTGTSQMSGHITLDYDPSSLAFISADSTVVSETASSLTFDYSNLNPFETRVIEVTFSLGIPPAVTVNTILIFTVTINPISGDQTEYDNVYTFTQQAVGSYDPNDITVLEGDQILLEQADKYLHYVIRFQNTGTFNALNIRVHNTLDDKLDWSTLQLENSSHSNRVEIQDGNEVDFIFNAIYLPDSTANEAESHGFIAYKIKPKANVVIGDIFSNKADIFFDFNPAVETNTVTTEIVEPVGLNQLNRTRFTVYPVPTTGVLHIKSETKIIRIEVYNHLGQVLLVNVNKNKIDLSKLIQGMYYCIITDENGATATNKIIKK